ncbi:MAG TPA: NAD(P)H-binding protein [Candidatus Krumholzibacteria bacterium]|nr:NAD(P)H-binding protein [Candidatus Krumholzibacteria bacterium]
MITILGASGKTGRAAAEMLLDQGEKVRVIARNREHLAALVKQGAEAMVGDAGEAHFLASALHGSDAVYALIPPNPTHPDFLAYADDIGEGITQAVRSAGVKHVVFLSSLGAELPSETGPIVGLHRQEKRFAAVKGLNTVSLRAGFFFENHFMSLPLIKHEGINGSAMAGDYGLAQIASRDVGAAAARALRERDFEGFQVRELLGPRDLSMDEATRILGAAIGNPDLKYVQFPYDAALEAMVTAGLSKSMASMYVEMSKAFNEGMVKSLEGRNQRNTTPTRFEDFATHVLAPVYRAQ